MIVQCGQCTLNSPLTKDSFLTIRRETAGEIVQFDDASSHTHTTGGGTGHLMKPITMEGQKIFISATDPMAQFFFVCNLLTDFCGPLNLQVAGTDSLAVGVTGFPVPPTSSDKP